MHRRFPAFWITNFREVPSDYANKSSTGFFTCFWCLAFPKPWVNLSFLAIFKSGFRHGNQTMQTNRILWIWVDGVDDFSCIFGTHRSWLFHRHFVSPAMSRRHLGSWDSKTSHPLEHVRMDYSSILGQKHLSSCPTPSRMATSFFALFLGIRSGNAHQSIYIFSRKKRTFSLTCNLAGPQSDPIASSGFFQPN